MFAEGLHALVRGWAAFAGIGRDGIERLASGQALVDGIVQQDTVPIFHACLSIQHWQRFGVALGHSQFDGEPSSLSLLNAMFWGSGTHAQDLTDLRTGVYPSPLTLFITQERMGGAYWHSLAAQRARIGLRII